MEPIGIYPFFVSFLRWFWLDRFSWQIFWVHKNLNWRSKCATEMVDEMKSRSLLNFETYFGSTPTQGVSHHQDYSIFKARGRSKTYSMLNVGISVIHYVTMSWILVSTGDMRRGCLCVFRLTSDRFPLEISSLPGWSRNPGRDTIKSLIAGIRRLLVAVIMAAFWRVLLM